MGGGVVAHLILVSPPVPIGLGFGTALGLGLGLWGLNFGLWDKDLTITIYANVPKYEVTLFRLLIKKNISINFIGPRKRSERGLTKPLLLSTGAHKSATENHHF